MNLDRIHGELQHISADLVAALKSKYIRLVDLLVPLSMAMLTVYDEEYLGIPSDEPTDPAATKDGEK